ncbi:MAG: PD-(D/E)XK nuclease family protein [Caldilineaceae bacterium]|nr:PD-(D/E)XK nuclease family protein [Caldilineaceae bacterium]
MTLDLPTTFAFSQSSLQAYSDCARRFWLAYVQRLPWPAVEAGPVHEYEEQMRRGSAFHQVVQRAETGLDLDLLAARLQDDDLLRWFDAYRRHRPAQLPDQHVEVERILSVPFGSEDGVYRLAAQYDLIAAEKDGRAVIVDWKTNQHPTRRNILHQRLQTIVYPFVLVEASESLPWGPVEPEQVEMIYWFAEAPESPEIFRYSADQHAVNRTRLQALVREILSGDVEADFPLVPDTEQNRRRLCDYCVYRSRCDRGETAGPITQIEDVEFFTVDLEQALEFTLDEVEELAF